MALRPARGGLFVDCTVGLGGHTAALLEAGASRVIGLDRDADALAAGRRALDRFGDRVELVHADYRDLAAVLDARRASRRRGRRARRPGRVVACNWTRGGAGSVSGATSRSTCGWTSRAGETAADVREPTPRKPSWPT